MEARSNAEAREERCLLTYIPDLLNPISYDTLGTHGGSAHNDLCSPTPIINQENEPEPLTQTYLVGNFSQLMFPTSK